MVRVWVFDLDGTLVDSFSPFFSALESIFKKFGVIFSNDLQKEALTIPLIDFFTRYLGHAHASTALRLLDQRSLSDAEHVRMFAGIEELLVELRRQGVDIGIWTNRDRASALEIVKHSGLSKFTENIVTGDCVQFRKPDPEGLIQLAQRFGVPAAHCLMVGDHDVDVRAAKQVGARAIRASWHGHWREDRCQWSHYQFRNVLDFSAWANNQFIAVS